MTDLFSHVPNRVGYGNAAFLCDLADNVPDHQMRQRARDGAYPHLRADYAKGWRRLFGRS